jgi:hypothetical protein
VTRPLIVCSRVHPVNFFVYMIFALCRQGDDVF